MSSESSNTRRILGIVIAISIFIIWVIVDMYAFSSITASLGYPMFELVAYGSWFLVILIMFAVLSIFGVIPNRSTKLTE